MSKNIGILNNTLHETMAIDNFISDGRGFHTQPKDKTRTYTVRPTLDPKQKWHPLSR
jgi:hypothetical protein